MRRCGCLLASVLALGCDGADPTEQPFEGVEPLPQLERCDPVRTWDEDHRALEDAMHAAIDDLRAEAHGCQARGWFDAAPVLRRRGSLDCAARLHALDMASQDFVDHVNPDDETAWDRLRAVEYAYASADETIARTDMPPQSIVSELWGPREGSCAALSASAYVDVGIGVASVPEGARHWTVILARPLP